MTAVYIIDNPTQPGLVEITKYDIKLKDPHCQITVIDFCKNANEQLERLILAAEQCKAGDIFCIAGVALRTLTWNLVDIAIEKNINLIPGQTVDHRLVPIPNGKFFSKKPQELNQHPANPYVMILGNPAGAIESWKTIQQLDPAVIWAAYLPDSPTINHWLSAAAALHQSWISPEWFPLVDMSIRDLELAPVMYASNQWSDWIAFYPANGNFKLENHTQLNPVWFDFSEKPLEYWRV